MKYRLFYNTGGLENKTVDCVSYAIRDGLVFYDIEKSGEFVTGAFPFNYLVEIIPLSCLVS